MKKVIKKIAKDIILSTVISFIAFFLGNVIVRAVFSWTEYANNIVLLSNYVVFMITFYNLHFKNEYLFYEHHEKYDIREELKAFYIKEGKYLLLIYGGLALACEVSLLFSGRFIPTLCLNFFPFSIIIMIPVVRTIVSLVAVCITFFLMVMIHGKKSYKQNKKGE